MSLSYDQVSHLYAPLTFVERYEREVDAKSPPISPCQRCFMMNIESTQDEDSEVLGTAVDLRPSDT
jgi:hypothetical protein